VCLHPSHWCHLSSCSSLDYGNATLVGIPSHLIKQIQSVKNSAARLVFSTSRYDNIMLLLTQLHWLKIPERIEFKLAVLVYTRQLCGILHRNSTRSRLLSRPISVSALLCHHCLSLDAPVFQPSAIKLLSSLFPDCEKFTEIHIYILHSLCYFFLQNIKFGQHTVKMQTK